MQPSPAIFQQNIEHLEVIKRLAASRAGFLGRIYLVGGALRELALQKVPKDYDFALEKAEDLGRLEVIFQSHSFLLGKKPLQTHRLVAGPIAIDITILDTAIDEDLLRRDFTVNAMAYDVFGKRLIDPLGGMNDIAKKTLRFPKRASLKEDPLRMVKAIRHLAMLGGFSLDKELRSAIKEDKSLIHQTAAERIKYELDLIMLSPWPHKGFRAMQRTGLLFELFPELIPMRQMDIEKAFELETFGHTLAGYKYIRRARKLYPYTEKQRQQTGYALLFHDLGKPYTFSYDEEKERVHFFYHERHSSEIAEKIMERLRFSTAESRSILKLIENHMRLFLISHKEATEKATRRAVYKLEELTPSLVFLTILDLFGTTNGAENESTAQVVDRCREVLQAFEEWKKEPLAPLLTGHDLLSLGFKQGPHLGKVLTEIREQQIAGEMMKKEQAIDYAKLQITADA